jgi:hypothetical protein
VIPPVVLLVRRDIISIIVPWTLAPNTDMPLEMMKVPILRAICKICCDNLCANPEVAIGIENGEIPAFGGCILRKAERLLLPLEYFVQHLSVRLPLLNQLRLWDTVVLD